MKEEKKNYNEITSNILKEYADKILQPTNFMEISDVLNEMIDEINNAFGINIISGEEILVKNILRYLKTNEEYKNYEIDKDKIQWVLKTFHDNYFKYDEMERGVIKSLDEVIKNY